MFKSPCKVNENIDNKIASKFEIALQHNYYVDNRLSRINLVLSPRIAQQPETAQ